MNVEQVEDEGNILRVSRSPPGQSISRHDDETSVSSTFSDQLMRRYGSKPGKGRNKNRRRAEEALLLNRDYFMDNSTYDDVDFQKRFRVPKSVFFRLFSEVCRNDPYFLQKKDAPGVLGLTSEQNICTCLQMLAYGTAADSFDQ
jgi:hypothetical protein